MCCAEQLQACKHTVVQAPAAGALLAITSRRLEDIEQQLQVNRLTCFCILPQEYMMHGQVSVFLSLSTSVAAMAELWHGPLD